MRKHDWADDLAKRIAFDLGAEVIQQLVCRVLGVGSLTARRGHWFRSPNTCQPYRASMALSARPSSFWRCQRPE